MAVAPSMKKPSRNRPPRFPREVAVLYEDDAVIVLNKPAGLPAVPIPRSSTPSALSLLTDALRLARQRALVVHRIDRFTSGILLFAKTQRDREALISQFLKHSPVREYLAVVRGRLAAAEGELVHHLKRVGMEQKVRREGDDKATRAELQYAVERPLRDASLVRVRLVTGLQNQIRAQFLAIGHPVVGDRKYAPGEAEERRIDRVALHAARLEFTHPRTGEKVTVECPPPADFAALVRALAPRRK
jgi:23S rRNA pseudouridine1911/1915/1917 synthase